MCGIVVLASSYTTGLSKDEFAAFTDMLVIDSFRGMDSTGVFGVDKQANVRIAKQASHGLDFVQEDAYDKLGQELIKRGLFAVGHNRAATKGVINDRNAHPFWVDDKIVLVQNGTVRGDHKKLTKNTEEVEVDSEAITHVLAEEADIAAALRKVDSAYALVWFNTDTETLHIIRNYERPFWISRCKRHQGFIGASEKATLVYAITKYRLEYEDPEEIPVNTLFSFKIKGNTYEETKTPIDNTYKHNNAYYGGGRNRHMFSDGLEGSDFDEWPGYPEIPTTHSRKLGPPFQTKPTSGFASHLPAHAVSKQNDLKLPFAEYAMDNLPDFHMDHHMVVGALEELRALDKDPEIVTIEIDGFIEANKENNCHAWHVWGAMLGGDTLDGPRTKVLAHWIVYDKPFLEMKNYIADLYFTAKPSAFSTMHGKKDGKEVSILKSFCTDVKPFAMVVNNEKTQAQVLH